jgi:hypothetical protein
MKIWPKPILYTIIHIISGYIAYYYPVLLVAIFGYQVLQLVFNVRVFFFSWKIEPGNSIEHTLVKLIEYALGYFIAFMLNNSSSKV